MFDPQSLETTDPAIANAILQEFRRQEKTLELIASENITSRAVRAAQGSVLTNKYAEGYPGKRYYGGCEVVDIVETLAIERAKTLFGACYANVQAHSGSQANMAVLFAYLNPGDAILSMNLAHGGHLTHGSPVSFSGRLFRIIPYGVHPKTGCIDYDQVEALAKEHRPRMIIAGASAYARTIHFDRFAAIAQSVDAVLMVDMAHIAGLVAAGLHPSPIPYADVVTSTTHKTLRGPRGGLIVSGKECADILNRQIFPGIQGGPLMHVIAAKAVAFQEALQPAFREYQRQIVANAARLAQCLLSEGIDLVSGGTDNHMMLADLTRLGITGKQAEYALGQSGITVNKNAVPFETRSPHVTSGIRIGTPAVTSRGMKEPEMERIARWIVDVLRHPNDESLQHRIRSEVHALCDTFPIQR